MWSKKRERPSTFPGIAVAVVKDGHVIVSKEASGVRKMGEPAPVTPNTLFQESASNTKAFSTAASLAILVDQHKLSWDDRVIDHLPWFQMSDPYVTVRCVSATCWSIVAASPWVPAT